MKYLKELLKNIGLTAEEADVYVTVLRLGFPKISDLSKEVKIPRTSIYLHIDKLVKKGFLKKSRKKGVVHMSAVEPNEVIAQQEREVENLRAALPDFEKLMSIGNKQPVISFFDSAEGIQKFYDSLGDIKSDEIIYCIESKKTLQHYFQKTGWGAMSRVQKRLADQGIPVKGIITEDALPILKSAPPEAVSNIKNRALSSRVISAQDLQISIDFYLLPPNKIFFLITHENSIIEITNVSFYESLKSIFLYIYEQSTPINFDDFFASESE